MVKVVNQMRCVSGAPALKWDHDLMCQAQKGTDEIGDVMKHTDCYNLPIKAGENLASGHEVDTAAYMWFSEYLQQGTGSGDARYADTGHYSAMSWKAVTKMGCGILSAGTMQGFVRCQFTGGDVLPNMGGAFDKQMGAYDGNAAKLKECGLDTKKMKEMFTKYKKWGILNPKAPYTAGIGLYDMETDIRETDIAPRIEPDMSQHFTPMFVAALAVAGISLIAMGVVVGRKTRGPYVAPEDNSDEELLHASSIE